MLRPILDFFWETPGAALVPCASATGSLLEEFDPGGGYTPVYVTGVASGITLGGQSWQAPAGPGTLNGVCLSVYTDGTPTGLIKLQLYAHSGTFGTSSVGTGSALAESVTYDVTGLGSGIGNRAFQWFPFVTPYAFSAGEQLVFGLNGDAVTGDGSNYVAILGKGTGGHEGNSSKIDNGSWATVSGDLSFKAYGAAATPPYTEDLLKTIDYGTRAVVTVSNTLSSDETNALKIDLSQLSPEEGTGKPVTQVYIEQIKAVTSGLDVDILWDATTPEPCLLLTGDSGVSYDFRAVGPLTNNAGAGKTGNILFSTNGASAGSSYSVTLVMRKKY